MEQQIDLTGIDPLHLLGVDNGNLKRVEAAVNATIISRGSQLTIVGSDTDVSHASLLIHDLIDHVSREDALSLADVETYIRIHAGTAATPAPFSNARADVILHTEQGPIKPRTDTQAQLLQSVDSNDVVFSIGPAGTGKTYVSVAIAVSLLKQQRVRKIVLTRPVVQAGEDLGYLPGDFRQKVNPYLRPLLDALEEFLERDLLQKYMEQDIIEIAPLAYMRGRTLNHAFILLDEAQNTTPAQMKMFLTRLGRHSKTIINGDITQIDLPKAKSSGLVSVQTILREIEGIDFIYFNTEDVVRHRLVMDIINAYEEKQS